MKTAAAVFQYGGKCNQSARSNFPNVESMCLSVAAFSMKEPTQYKLH